MNCRYLTIMDATHNITWLHWKLFTIIIRYEYENWIPGVYILCKYKDKDIILVFLLIL